MSILSLDNIIAAVKQRLILNRGVSRTVVAAIPFSVFDQNGNPGAGVLAGTSTTTGSVPTDATAGCPTINAFGSGSKGYIARLEFNSSTACRIILYDLLWKGGAYAFNAAVSGQTSSDFSSRVPGGTDFTGLELYMEQVAAGTGIQNVVVGYTNQSGVSGRSTPVTPSGGAAAIAAKMTQLPLQAGDSGVSAVNAVTGSVASAGTFNILVMRRLGEARIRIANDAVIQDFNTTGLPEVFTDSALYLVVVADSTGSGFPEVVVDIING